MLESEYKLFFHLSLISCFACLYAFGYLCLSRQLRRAPSLEDRARNISDQVEALFDSDDDDYDENDVPLMMTTMTTSSEAFDFRRMQFDKICTEIYPHCVIQSILML